MSNEMMLNIWWLSFLGGLALLCFMLFKTMNFIEKQTDKKHHKEEFCRKCYNFWPEAVRMSFKKDRGQ